MPNPIYLLYKSVGTAALDATVTPGSLKLWIATIENHVARYGKYSKPSVLYLRISPPPFFWDYKCKKCRWWQEPNSCKVVEGKISPQGWCAIWVPPEEYRAFTWPRELIKRDW